MQEQHLQDEGSEGTAAAFHRLLEDVGGLASVFLEQLRRATVRTMLRMVFLAALFLAIAAVAAIGLVFLLHGLATLLDESLQVNGIGAVIVGGAILILSALVIVIGVTWARKSTGGRRSDAHRGEGGRADHAA